MYCSKCGKEVPEQAKFCNHCGNPLQQIATNKKLRTDSADKNTFMFMQLVTVGLVMAFLWFLFQPVAWVEPCSYTDYKIADLNIIEYFKEIVIDIDEYERFNYYYDDEITASDIFNYMEAKNKKEMLFPETLVVLSRLTFYGATILGIIEIILIFFFGYKLIKCQEYAITYLATVILLEIVRAIMLVWHIYSLGNEDMMYRATGLRIYPYYAIYVKTVAAIIVLFVLHTVYFRNRKVVDNKA